VSVGIITEEPVRRNHICASTLGGRRHGRRRGSCGIAGHRAQPGGHGLGPSYVNLSARLPGSLSLSRRRCGPARRRPGAGAGPQRPSGTAGHAASLSDSDGLGGPDPIRHPRRSSQIGLWPGADSESAAAAGRTRSPSLRLSELQVTRRDSPRRRRRIVAGPGTRTVTWRPRPSHVPVSVASGTQNNMQWQGF
jgi:hypothetical protein